MIYKGSFFTIYFFAAVYLLAVADLIISWFAATQQHAMLMTFFLFMFFVILVRLYASIESMSVWAQWFTRLNPVSYFIEVMRMIALKGSCLAHIARSIVIVAAFAIALNVWVVLSYRKRVRKNPPFVQGGCVTENISSEVLYGLYQQPLLF